MDRREEKRTGRSRLPMVVALLATIGLFALAFLAAQRMQAELFAERPRDIPKIVVLPFENVGPREDQDLADAMTEEIANRLASLRGLHVIGRHSSGAYTGTAAAPAQIAHELDVQYVVTGSVRQDKSEEGKSLVRVSPTLTRGSDGTQMWSEAYQTAPSGMFTVQAKIATQIASSLNIPVLTPEKDAMILRPTSSPEIYRKYLRGRQLTERTMQVPQLREGIELLTQATREDPRFLKAWAQLSIAHTRMFWFSGDRTQERLDQAMSALRRADALEEGNPDVHLARGVLLYLGRRDLEGALNEFKQVVAARPSDVTAILYTAAINRRLGRMDAALDGWKSVTSLDPRNPANFTGLASTLMFLRQYADAEKWVDKARSLGADNPEAVRLKSTIALDARGNVLEAIEHLRGARNSLPPAWFTNVLQAMTWPAVEDPDLRRYMINVVPSGDIASGRFYANKLKLYYYIGDSARVRAYADSAYRALEANIRESADPVPFYEELALVHATRGRRAEALRAMAKADELLPVGRDVFDGAQRDNLRVRMYMLLGDDDAALDQMEKRVNVNGGLSPFYLRRDPIYSRLISSPRFRRIVGL
jgi:TolB-like protein/cytochrome c-type biogenesis protein CcmH/NrfG